MSAAAPEKTKEKQEKKSGAEGGIGAVAEGVKIAANCCCQSQRQQQKAKSSTSATAAAVQQAAKG